MYSFIKSFDQSGMLGTTKVFSHTKQTKKDVITGQLNAPEKLGRLGPGDCGFCFL